MSAERAIQAAVVRVDLWICSPWPWIVIAIVVGQILACLMWRD